MRLLLTSGGFRTAERVRFLAAEMQRFFGDVKRLLFIPYALRDHDGYRQEFVEKGLHANLATDEHRWTRIQEGGFLGLCSSVLICGSFLTRVFRVALARRLRVRSGVAASLGMGR